MLSLVICEDEPGVAAQLAALAEDCLRDRAASLTVLGGIGALSQALEEGLRPDIVLMDVVLKDGSGIDAARALFPPGSKTQVIFVTGYVEYCSEVYETEHIYFLLKPVEPALLQRALEKAIQRLEEQKNREIVVQNGGKIHQIPVREIRYVEGRGRKVILHCTEETVEYYSTMTGLSEKLPRMFVRCHKSYLVNMDHVLKMDQRQFHLSNGQAIPISQLRRKEIRQQFLDHLRQKM